jgi:hypothetical protein
MYTEIDMPLIHLASLFFSHFFISILVDGSEVLPNDAMNDGMSNSTLVGVVESGRKSAKRNLSRAGHSHGDQAVSHSYEDFLATVGSSAL